MKMIVVALIGGAVLGFLDAKFVMDEIVKLVGDPETQKIVGAGVAAFLGAIWGWMAKGLIGSKDKS